MDSKNCRTEMDLKYYLFYPTLRDQMPTIKIPATGSNGLCANSSSTEPVVPGGSPLTVNKVSYVPMMPLSTSRLSFYSRTSEATQDSAFPNRTRLPKFGKGH